MNSFDRNSGIQHLSTVPEIERAWQKYHHQQLISRTLPFRERHYHGGLNHQNNIRRQDWTGKIGGPQGSTFCIQNPLIQTTINSQS